MEERQLPKLRAKPCPNRGRVSCESPTLPRKAEPSRIKHFKLHALLAYDLRIEIIYRTGIFIENGGIIGAALRKIDALNCGDKRSATDNRSC